MLNDKTILVTGGTGNFSKKFVKTVFEKYPPVSEAPRVAHNPIEPYSLVDKLIECFKEGEVIVGGNGTAFLLPFQVGKVKNNKDIFGTQVMAL